MERIKKTQNVEPFTFKNLNNLTNEMRSSMRIAKVMGTAVASAKHAALSSTKLLIVCPTNIDGDISGDPFLAVDLVGSGQGEVVIVSQGSSARLATDFKNSPVDAAIVGILDSLQYDDKIRFRKE